MTAIKQARTWLIKRIVGGPEAVHETYMKELPAPAVVLGFPRSGTSMLGQLLSAAGFFFGEAGEDMTADIRNPRGYFEYGPLFRLSRAFLKEAGITGDLDPAPHGLRARGPLARLSRGFTRRSMMSTLDTLGQHAPFGVKLFPRFYYFWQQYLPPHTKIVAIYREPRAVARSFLKAWPGGRYTLDQLLTLWNEHNRDLLFQVNEAGERAFLVKYEDLLDASRSTTVLTALAAFLEVSPQSMNGIIDASLNRSEATTDDVPLPASVRETYEALEAKRSYRA